MKELLAAAASFGANNLKYAQNITSWSDSSRYSVFIPYGYRRHEGKFEVRASSIDMKRVFGGIFVAMGDPELSSPGSLLTQAIDKTGTNKFGKSMMLLNGQGVQGNTLLHVDLYPLCNVLAHIGNALQERVETSDREKAFWSAHLGAVKNEITWYDFFNCCKRSERDYPGRDLSLPRPNKKWIEYLDEETRAKDVVQASAPVPEPAPPAPTLEQLEEMRKIVTEMTDALVEDAYAIELVRLRTKGAARVETPSLDPQSELSKKFAAARDRAQVDFLASLEVPETEPEVAAPELVEPEVIEPVIDPPAHPRLPPLVISGEPELPRPAPV